MWRCSFLSTSAQVSTIEKFGVFDLNFTGLTCFREKKEKNQKKENKFRRNSSAGDFFKSLNDLSSSMRNVSDGKTDEIVRGKENQREKALFQMKQILF